MVGGEERSANTINQRRRGIVDTDEKRRGNVVPDEKNKNTTDLKGNRSKEWNVEVFITFMNQIIYVVKSISFKSCVHSINNPPC